ncbi:MAG: CCA tRNA nucleotidyltransferase [Alteraurantiacibacter sp.]
MAKLPENDWTSRPDLAALVAAVGAQNLRWVGGAVRDTLLDLPVKDIDAATTLHPEEVMQRLKKARIKCVPTGLDHGTVTAVLDGGPVEVTTLRKDVATDGRHAVIEFAQAWEDDAARRDFTINALFVHPETLEISDFFDGLADLKARRVRFIGDARERIREDHLRILRYYRFQARFGSTLDAEGEEACTQLAPMLKGLSRERVAMEISGLLSLTDPYATVLRMYERGVLDVILPEVTSDSVERLAALVRAEQRQDAPPEPIRRLASLLPADPRIAKQVAARLRLSNAHKKRLIRLAGRARRPGDARVLAYREGMAVAQDLLLMSDQPMEMLENWEAPQFPLRGGEIVARGVAAGPEVARILQTVESRWLEEGFPTRDRVEQLLDEALDAGSHL